jgi:hypothetical protein
MLVFSGSSKSKIEYPNIPSAMKPMPHGDLPTTISPFNWRELSILSEEEEEGP